MGAHRPSLSNSWQTNSMWIGGLIAKYECGLLLPPVHLAFLISRYFKIPMEALLAKPLRTTRKEICT